jgi:hypothetical protein
LGLIRAILYTTAIRSNPRSVSYTNTDCTDTDSEPEPENYQNYSSYITSNNSINGARKGHIRSIRHFSSSSSNDQIPDSNEEN